MTRFGTIFSFRGTISRAEYLFIALAGVVVKHTVDFFVALGFGRTWNPLNYLLPLGVPVPIAGLGDRDLTFIAVMAAISIPFAWVGLAITTRRLRTLGWPLWLVVAFFVPVANIVSFALAAAWPEGLPHDEARIPRLARYVPADSLGAAVFALLVTAALGTALVPLGTVVLGSYGWGLFAAIPFVQGAIAAYVLRLHAPHSLGASISVAITSVLVTGLGLLGLALEGALCIAMAMPIAVAFAIAGAVFGHSVGGGFSRPNVAATLLCIMLAPAIMGVEAIAPRDAPGYLVTTSIDIDAPPAAVWQHVVSFPALPPPKELAFRAGVAYPESARIVGSGVGAVRFCTFSTGAFVEPITAWEPGRRLAFSVVQNAEPMREWSPYGRIDAPHLHGYMQSRQGEFVLEALPGGGTRLTGRTWYQHHLWPAAYWSLWSDSIVHQIHGRVLRHIKTLSETHA